MNKLTWILMAMIFCGQVSGQDGSIDAEVFKEWIQLRIGDGKDPAIWYCFGEVYSYPEGVLLTKMEGIDIATRQDVTADSVFQLNRKIFVYTDPKTGEVLDSMNGQAVQHIAYPYQWITYVHKDTVIATYVEQGTEPRITQMGPGYRTKYRKAGEASVFSSPVFLNFETPRGKYEAYENYDFILDNSQQATADKYKLTWVRYGDAPPFTGVDKAIIQLICHRVDKMTDISPVLYEYIKTEAPLWLNPPKDLEEIRSLQKTP